VSIYEVDYMNPVTQNHILYTLKVSLVFIEPCHHYLLYDKEQYHLQYQYQLFSYRIISSVLQTGPFLEDYIV